MQIFGSFMANCLPSWDFLFILSRNVLWPTTGKKYTDTVSHLCILLISLIFSKLLVFSFLDECLFSRMEKLGRRLFLGEAMFYFNQVLHAVDYLHTLPTPVIHKDIKGEISFSIQGSIFLFLTESSARQVSWWHTSLVTNLGCLDKRAEL